MRIAKMIASGVLGGGKVDPQQTGLTMTVTTTGAQTLTLQGITVATGKSIVVDWGDGNSDTYSAGAGTRTHAYAGAGTWTVTLTKRGDITLLDFRDTKITSLVISNTNPLPAGLTYLYLSSLAGLTYNANTNPLPAGLKSLTLYNLAGLTYNANTNPLPTGLTYLNLSSLAGLTYNANTNPLPTGLTYLYLNSLAGLTWEINASQPWPTGATACVAIACPSVTVSAWTDNAIRSVQLENAYSQANVDAVLNAILANKANFTYATPTLDLLGGSNAAPSGTYQAADPVTSGKEAAYALVNGNGSYAAGPEWTVTTA